MDNVKPWQIILIVVAIAFLGFSVWKFGFSHGPDLPDSVILVDVKTGDLFRLDISGRKAGYYPELNPDTGERALIPAYKADDGTWMISRHSLPVLQDVTGDTPAVLDRGSGRVEVKNESIRALRR